MSKQTRSVWQVYKWPTALALITTVGLLSALLGDGVWNCLSWLLLAIPLVVIAGRILNAQRRRMTRRA